MCQQQFPRPHGWRAGIPDSPCWQTSCELLEVAFHVPDFQAAWQDVDEDPQVAARLASRSPRSIGDVVEAACDVETRTRIVVIVTTKASAKKNKIEDALL